MPVKIKEITEKIKGVDWKTLIRKPAFWTVAISGFTVLFVLVFLVIALTRPVDRPQPPEETLGTELVTQSTEATLPPPEANPIGLGDFYMDGDYLSCLYTPSVLGIDVSFWQDTVDWGKVKEAGVEFAMIRAGCRYSESGNLDVDDFAQTNYQGAKDAGIQVGVYFFSQATSVEEAVAEADYLLDIIKDWQVDMPVVFDWEIDPEGRTAKVDGRTLTDCTKAFCDRVKTAGYTPMVYFSKSQSLDTLYLAELTDYKFWLAHYDTVLNYPYKIDMWQYTETGSVPGISGNVDINLYFPWEA